MPRILPIDTIIDGPEIRETPDNPAFTGYCTEFRYRGNLVAVVDLGAPIADLIKAEWLSRYGKEITCTRVSGGKLVSKSGS
jgi:hypothetical protein